MDRMKKAAVLVNLVDLLCEKGGRTGETHVQEAVFFLQELTESQLGFEFVLYLHGPFSFDLRDELTSLRADGLLTLEPQALPLGARLATTLRGRDLRQRFPRTLESCKANLEWIANFCGSHGGGELKRLANALFVTREMGSEVPVERRATRLHELKPQITLERARDAMRGLDEVIRRALPAA